MLSSRLLLKKPFNFLDMCLIYPPTIGDILDLENETRGSYETFSVYLNCLTETQFDIDDEFYIEKDNCDKKRDENSPTPWKNFLEKLNNDEEKIKIQEAIYFFTKEKILILPDKELILIGDISKTNILCSKNFEYFQNLIRLSCGKDLYVPEPDDIHPKLKRMNALSRYRDRIKAKQNTKNSLPFLDSLVHIFSFNIGITPFNLREVPFGLIHYLYSDYQNKDKYRTDINLMASFGGGKGTKPKNWITKFEENK
jgi:hypothetical protein